MSEKIANLSTFNQQKSKEFAIKDIDQLEEEDEDMNDLAAECNSE